MSVFVAGVAAATAITHKGGDVSAVYTATGTADHGGVTSSTSYIDVPNMKITVHVPSSQKALLVITFSADTDCLSTGGLDEACYLNALVDGAPAGPQEFHFSAGKTGHASLESVQWVAGPLTSGDHVVDIQYKTSHVSTYTDFFVYERTLTVLRTKV
jgi:hypothetical protein